MPDTLTAAQLIALMNRCPVEARPPAFDSWAYGVQQGAISKTVVIEQACIGALVQWLDAWCEKQLADIEHGIELRMGNMYAYIARCHAPDTSRHASTRLESLVALVEQLAKEGGGDE